MDHGGGCLEYLRAEMAHGDDVFVKVEDGGQTRSHPEDVLPPCET
jgi:hypothetical protein